MFNYKQKGVSFMELKVKQKLELKSKNQSANVELSGTAVSQVLVDLGWKTAVDLDLMAFIEKKDGTKFALITDNISNDKNTMGNLNDFPFMTLSGDEGVGDKIDSGDENKETIKCTKIDESVAKVDIVALNYKAASENDANATFNGLNAAVKITVVDKNNGCDVVDVPLTASEAGVAAHIATIDNTSPIGAQLINKSAVYNLSGLVNAIPAAQALVS